MGAASSFASRTPVIAGVGEVCERSIGREPVDLMAEAVRAAHLDACVGSFGNVDSLDIVNEISWPYPDVVALLCERLGIRPSRARYGPVGGESPVRFIHEAALRIQAGASETAIVCGAEAEASVRWAARDGVPLAWSQRVENFEPVRAGNLQREITRRLECAIPTNVYPLYESAARAEHGLSFAEAQAESATMWAGLSAVASTRPHAWQRRIHDASEISTPTHNNRRIAWPYPKLMAANPIVNQGAAVILTSLARARALGVPEEHLVFPWGGAAADEPSDILERTGYAHAPAMRATLQGAMRILEEEQADLGPVELYSCFPVVPKLARRELGRPAEAPISVTGGLTFFGAPLNNYMGHATVAMVECLRACGDGAGLLYGQGGYVTKHHGLVLATRPARRDLAADYRILGTETPSAITVSSEYSGPAVVEAFTVLFDRDGLPRHGIVVARTGRNSRAIAKAADEASILRLLSTQVENVAASGRIKITEGMPLWTF